MMENYRNEYNSYIVYFKKNIIDKYNILLHNGLNQSYYDYLIITINLTINHFNLIPPINYLFRTLMSLWIN